MRLVTKWTILTIIVVFSSVGIGFCASAAKVGMIDAQRLINESEAGKDRKSELIAVKKNREEELNKGKTELEEFGKRLQRESAVMTNEKLQEKAIEFQHKKLDFNSALNKYNAELRRLEAKVADDTMSEAQEIIEELGRTGGYLLIVMKPAVLYPSPIDITDEVIKKYNAQYVKNKKNK